MVFAEKVFEYFFGLCRVSRALDKAAISRASHSYYFVLCFLVSNQFIVRTHWHRIRTSQVKYKTKS
jgi:hypothetical protein